MARSGATTVEQYLAELPPERRAVVGAVREVVVRNLPPGIQERMNWGMISYEVPLARYTNTYNRQPLAYAALAAQKNHYALYLMGAYMMPAQAERLRSAFQAAGKKMDMGKSCLRFHRLEDLPLDAVGEVIARGDVDELIQLYEASRAGSRSAAAVRRRARGSESPG